MTRDEKVHGYVLGSLSQIEREAVARERLADPKLDSLINELEQSLAPLTAAAGEAVPSDRLFERLEAAIERERNDNLSGKTVLTFEEGNWRPCLPGIEAKRLWSERAMLLRCRPGAVVPPHGHAESEHMIVVSGDLIIGGRTLRVGDYHAIPAGHDHGEVRTAGGCVLFVQYVA